MRTTLYGLTLAIGCTFFLAGQNTAQNARQGNLGPGEHYAFLVACADYDRKELQPLQYPRNDIAELHQALLDAGMRQENVVVLHDRRTERRYLPEIRKIRDELKLLLAEMRPEDTLVVGLAGHGVQFKGEKQAYFCPVDAKMSDRSTLLPLDELYRELEKCKAQRKLVLIDACRNDPLSALGRGNVAIESVTRPQVIDAPQGIVVLHSCAAGQTSFEDPKLGHGIFFYNVLQGYRGQADLDKDNLVTMDELATYVTRETQRYARVSLGASQMPQRRGEFAGDWVLRQTTRPVVQVKADEYAPDDCEFLLSVNLEQILNAPAAKERIDEIKRAFRQDHKYQETLEATGFDPLQDIASILIASPAADADGQFNRMVIIVHGRFDPARVMASWDRESSNKLHRVPDGFGGQYLIYETTPSNGQRTYMAVVNRTTIVMGMQGSSVIEVLQKASGRRKTNLKNKHLQLILDNRFDPKASAWMVFMGNAYQVNGQPLRDLGLRYFIGTLNLTTELDIKLIFSADNNDVVKAMAVPAEWRKLISDMVGNRQDVAGPIIQGSMLYPAGTYLYLKGKVDADAVVKWIDLF